MPDPRDRSSPDYDPWENPDNKIVQWTDSDDQINQKIVDGPDTGLHRYYDPQHNFRSGETGYSRQDDQD